jgi:glycosyltransferase involved in cell wall biosynthesis
MRLAPGGAPTPALTLSYLEHSGGHVKLAYDLVCLSHLRWDFVYQRPHHLVSRFAKATRVFFVEEPLPLNTGDSEARLDVSPRENGPIVVVPRLPSGLAVQQSEELQGRLLAELFAAEQISAYVLWYYTPMALGCTADFPPPVATVYDCMDELSAFQDAPEALLLRERQLFRQADLVFTGGRSLYEAKRLKHPAVYCFPSSVDVHHFRSARSVRRDPADQEAIGRPRLGFFGVLDERLDVDLLAAVADLRPAWQLILLGPTAKIDATGLPRRANIHYLGPKTYSELPHYLAGWDVALIPFARNEATRYISPTKTPEYLAAGCPVISTSIRDVVEPYGRLGLARIADEPEELVAAVQASIAGDRATIGARADELLATSSWDTTWCAMVARLEDAIAERMSRADEGRLEHARIAGA